VFRNFKVLVMALVAVMTALPASARGPERDWVLLGEQRVGFRVDRDVINVGDGNARFSQLRIMAENNDVHLINLRLVYQNGYAEDLKVDQLLRAGVEALPVDLRGERSYLKQIEMTYRARPSFEGRAVVKVYGELRGERGRGGPDRPVAGGDFETIDTQRVGRDDDGTAVFDLGRRDGRFSAIRFAAVDGGIRIRSVRVTYGNGETQTVDVGDRLDEGDQTKVIDLEGERRFIRRVEVQARTRRSTRGPASIALLGRKDSEYRGRDRDRDDRADRGRDRDERGDRGRDRDDMFERGRKEEWITLGMQKANMLGADTDVFNVGREAGLFKAIRVVVEKQDVRFLGMTIVYGNGEREDVPLSGVVRAGETSQPFDLKGRERFIESVSFKYRAKLSLRGSARVTVQGLQHGWFRKR
jgi:hypothetical protein